MLFSNASALQQPGHFGTTLERRKKKILGRRFPRTIRLVFGRKCRHHRQEDVTARAIRGRIPELSVANAAKHTRSSGADYRAGAPSRKIGRQTRAIPVAESRGP